MRKAVLVTVEEAPDEDAEWDITVASTPTVEQVFDRLWDAAGSFESGVLMDLLITAGLIWECKSPQGSGYTCGYRNDESRETCEDCGAPRPAQEEKEEG